MSRIIVCSRCGETKKHCSRNLCQKCYDYERYYGDLSKYALVGCKRPSKRIVAPCNNCGKVSILTIKQGLCEKCYRQYKKQNNKIICLRCGRLRPHDSNGLCESCSSVERMKKNSYVRMIITCAICGEQKPHHAKGLCAKCYRREHKKTWKKKIIVCKKCKQIKEHMAHGLCVNCYLTPEMIRRYRHRRESLKRGLPRTLTLKEWNSILEKYNYSCAYCGRNDEPLTQEHWIPSSRGGGYTAQNIVPACSRCNSRKRSLTGEEYLHLLNKEKLYARANGSAS
jgi:NMD protein affecting ribosome stability and mRNA decay